MNKNPRKYNILLADDQPEEYDFTMLVNKLSHYNSQTHNVIFAKDGNEALKKILSHSIDIIVTDGDMPYATGDQIAEYSKIFFPKKPVMIHTFAPERYLHLANLGVIIQPKDYKEAYQFILDHTSNLYTN